MIMNIYEQDIFSQPKDIREAINFYVDNHYGEKIQKISDKKFSKIILTGMGSSYSACMNANTILRNSGLPCTVEPASQLLHYEIPSIDNDTLLVIVSQSGRSGEIVELIEKLSVPCTVVALTNDEESPLGKRADLLLNLHVKTEQAVSTRTYLAPIVLMHLFACAYVGKYNDVLVNSLNTSLDYLEESIGDFDELGQKMKAFFALPPYVALIGRGYDMSTVDGGALFIKEVAKYPSIPFDAGQFRHGPFEMIGSGFTAIFFATEGVGCEMQLRLAKDVAAKGSKVIVVTDSDQISDSENILVVHQKYVSPELACVVNILPVQCFGNYIAGAKGLKVGEFLFSNKITTVQ